MELPSIYFAHRRQVFRRSGMLLAVGPFTKPREGVAAEEPFETTVRYRTVGDMTCTAAVESGARTAAEIIDETSITRVSERGARARTTASRTPPWRTASARATSDGAAPLRDGRLGRQRQVASFTTYAAATLWFRPEM